MKCKVEQDLNAHLSRVDRDEEREAMVEMMAETIIQDERFEELFTEEEVFFSALKYIQSLIDGSDAIDSLKLFNDMKSAVNKAACKMADKFLKKDGR